MTPVDFINASEYDLREAIYNNEVLAKKNSLGITFEEALATTQRKNSALYRSFVVMGPAGTGKSMIMRFLAQTHPNLFVSSVSYTTRGARRTEQNGRDYNFVTEEVF